MIVTEELRYQSWHDVPLPLVVQVLERLRAGVVYFPQHFRSVIAHVAFGDLRGDNFIVPAVEGLELALQIANRLSLDYSVFNCEQETLRSIRTAAARRMSVPT